MTSPAEEIEKRPLATSDTSRMVRDRVDAFVRRHFHLAGTLRLHRAALGWDLLRAPVNVVFAPVFMSVKMTGAVAHLAGAKRLANWLSTRQIFLKTSVARGIETRIARDLLDDAEIRPRSRALIDDYTGVRGAVSEITTSIFVLLAGLALFGTATPGIASLAPKVSDYVAHASAVARFPFGSYLGQLWYGVFPVSMSVWVVVLIAAGLAMLASVVTTFAGIVADPIQARLGLHRRRLIRLVESIATVERQSENNAAENAAAVSSGLAPEHLLARLADLTDAGLSLLRIFRS